jgi:protein dithiol oxidoreductase (disulfide-forming)
MLKKFASLVLLFSVAIGSNALFAEDKPGYEAISPAQPTANPDKVEVIEFFWYGCPHCFEFEPTLKAWLKTKPANVEFIRIPAVFSEKWGRHAKAYYVAEALGVVDKVHDDFFDAIQVKNAELETEDQLAKFFVEHGVKESDFHDAFNSFMIDAKMRQAPQVAGKYGITGVPTVIVNGKYRTNGSLAGGHEKMIAVMDELIKKESGGK